LYTVYLKYCGFTQLIKLNKDDTTSSNPRVVLLWATRAAPVQPAQLHPPPPVFTPAVAGAARRKSGEQRGGRRQDCSFTHFPLFFHPLHSSLFLEVVSDLIRVGKAGSVGWLAGSGRLVTIRCSSLLLAWAGSLAAAAAVVAAAVPALVWPWLASGVGTHACGWPVVAAAWLGSGRGRWPSADLQLSAAPSAEVAGSMHWGVWWEILGESHARLRADSSDARGRHPYPIEGAVFGPFATMREPSPRPSWRLSLVLVRRWGCWVGASADDRR
jgi:hypothetical protein